MRFLADENVPRDIVRWLLDTGHDLIWAAEVQPGGLDVDWAKMAEQEQRIIITSDLDFGEIVYRDRLSRCGVLLLRFDDLTVSHSIVRLQAVWPAIEANATGQFIVVTEKRIRVRPLPYAS